MASLEIPDWRALDRAARDRAFNNAAAVADSAAIVAGWERRSASLRTEMRTVELAYGPRPRNRIDLIRAAESDRTLVFIHGGYWQMRAKETFTFVSRGPLAHGINVAHVGYTLAPEATMDDIVAEIGMALECLRRELPRHGAGDAIWLSGWSAGAHLAAMMLEEPGVRGLCLISGIYELEPMRHIYVNDALRLDAAGAVRNSPLRHIPKTAPPVIVVAGEAELPLMRGQSRDYAAALHDARLACRYEEIAGANHFSILEELAEPTGRLSWLIAEMAGASVRP